MNIEYLDGTAYTHLSGLSYNFDSESPYFRLFPETKFEDRNEPDTDKGGVMCELALADAGTHHKPKTVAWSPQGCS